MKKTLSLVFFALLSVNIVCREAGIAFLPEITKPLLMPVLMFMVGQRGFRRNVLLLVSLIFSWLGDIFLMFGGQLYFMLGLGGFLIAHVFYILIFIKYREFDGLKILPFLAFSVLMVLGVLGRHLPADLKIPVGLYITVITVMGITAAMATRLPAVSYRPVLIGAVLFILSDSFIAVDKFVDEVPLAGFWVMSTYGIAQFLIVKGLLERVD